ncbi:DUF362 domain-containing protein [candidate division WOR-3 bacterium]|nr:DUF362 domain-containing protein [candidate division WOR-3 bacterium]
MKGISRRDFIRCCGAGALGLMLKPDLFGAQTRSLGRASDVVQCFDENATSGSSINEPVVQIMMDASIKQLTGINDVGEAWKSVFPGIIENSIIGIKINAINEYLPAHPEFVDCIINGLGQMQFGSVHFPKNNVIVWDRTDLELVEAGYTIYDGSNPDTARCFGTNHSGVGYDYTLPFNVYGVTSYPSRILTQMADFLVNTAVMKDHNGAQVTLTMKNHYGSVHNPGSLHSTNYTCNPHIPAVNQQIRDVVTPNNIQKIFIVDGLFAKVNWGPSGPPNCITNKLLMSLDTVACDWQGQVLINEERVRLGYATISAPHILTAAAAPYNLGTTDVNLIEISNPSGIGGFNEADSPGGPAQVTPNPFRTRTAIIYSPAALSTIRIDLIDAAGRTQDIIFNGTLAAGTHRIEYMIKKELTAGSYFIRIMNNGRSTMKKITILR